MKFRTPFILLLAVFLLGCASQFTFLATSQIAAAEALKKGVKEIRNPTAEAALGDSLTQLAHFLTGEGEAEAAYWASEQAELYYQIAVLRESISQIEAESQALSDSLLFSQGILDTYQAVLNELKELRKSGK